MRSFWKRAGGWIALLALVVCLPLWLRGRGAPSPAAGLPRLVVLSPHNEAVRAEFGRAFAEWHRRNYGAEVALDWRSPGGTSEIVRYLTGGYTAAFRHEWEAAGNPWSAAVQAALLKPEGKNQKTGETADGAAAAARRAFLESRSGVGVDVFFGGGQYDHQRLAERGILVPCGLRARHPELFDGADPVIPRALGGELWYDPQDRYYGVCLATFGLCYNPRRWAEVMPPGTPPPSGWRDLANPALAGLVAAGDPSKSGSVAKAYEMLVQQVMAESAAAAGGATPEVLDRGWAEAMLLLRMIGANSRYFTNSAGKVTADVAAGDGAAGICLDSYGRFQEQWEREENAGRAGADSLRFVMPAGGTSVSADPVSLLRGAPHPELAGRFLDFLFSAEGQRLWNYRVGVPGGPAHYALRRLPIRRDCYTAEDRAKMSDPAADPFRQAASFTYHPEWTAPHFNLMRLLIRVMVVDCHPELKAAWAAVRRAGGPGRCPEAMAELRRLPFTHAECAAVGKRLKGNRDAVALAREWGVFFRAQCLRVQDLAGKAAACAGPETAVGSGFVEPKRAGGCQSP